MLKCIIILFLIGFHGEALAMKFTSKDFSHKGEIPQIFTCEGKDLSPELSWSDVPEGAKSLVMICHDPDAPFPGGWYHWVLFNLPASLKGLAQGVKDFPKGTGFGQNSWKRNDYGGPCPPSGVHRYFFRLYALDTVLANPDGSTPGQLEEAMKGHILGQTELMGTYIKLENR
jgi:Raf kinase inhibitor-like YbhB/YbcL family protein